MKYPPPQHNAATTPAKRGPNTSSRRPKIAAELPRKMKNMVKIHPTCTWRGEKGEGGRREVVIVGDGWVGGR